MTYDQQRVLVTGGLGFIGSHLVSRLRREGAHVTVIDIRAEPTRATLVYRDESLRDSVEVVAGSIDDRDLVTRLVQEGRPDFIFNLASYASTIERAMDVPRQTIGTNTLGLVNILEAVRLSDHTPNAIVHTSTDKVYGDAGGVPYDEVETPLQPRGVYDVSKLAADAFARMYHEVFQSPTVVLRLCNIFGPHDYNTGYRIVPRAMAAIFGEDAPRPPELYEDSANHSRDYLYVEDCVEALLRLGATPECRGGVFNLNGCRHLKTPDMLGAVVEAAAEVQAETDPKRAEEIRRQGVRIVPAHTVKGLKAIESQTCEGTRLREATGFSPSVSLPEGLRQTARAYQQTLAHDRIAAASSITPDLARTS